MTWHPAEQPPPQTLLGEAEFGLRCRSPLMALLSPRTPADKIKGERSSSISRAATKMREKDQRRPEIQTHMALLSPRMLRPGRAVPRDGGGRLGGGVAAVFGAGGHPVGQRQAAGRPRRDGGRGRAPTRLPPPRLLLRRRLRRTRRLLRRPVPQAVSSPKFFLSPECTCHIYRPSWRYRDELYKECTAALDGGAVLSTKNLEAITASIQRAFAAADANLSTWLEQLDKDDDSGATATAVFLRNDILVVSHIGDSCLQVRSHGGRPEALTNFHRPYGNNKTSLEEVKRIRAAGGWIVDGRICGDISVSRAFGDIRFKTQQNEMLVKGVKEGRWTEKFISQ